MRLIINRGLIAAHLFGECNFLYVDGYFFLYIISAICFALVV